MDTKKELYFLKELYFGTIQTLEHLDIKYDVASFKEGFKTGIFVVNSKKTRAINVLDDKVYSIFNFYSKVLHPVSRLKLFQQQGSEVVSQVFPLKAFLTNYNIQVNNDIFNKEELLKLNDKLYKEVLKDLDSDKINNKKVEEELTK